MASHPDTAKFFFVCEIPHIYSGLASFHSDFGLVKPVFIETLAHAESSEELSRDYTHFSNLIRY